jgi:hypothetical protein
MSVTKEFALSLSYDGLPTPQISTITATVTGNGAEPYFYSWYGPIGNINFSPVTIEGLGVNLFTIGTGGDGLFQLTVTDQNTPAQSLYNTITTTHGVPSSVPEIDIQLIYDYTNNTMNVSTVGQTAPLTYTWTTPYASPASTATITTLSGGTTAYGTYSVAVTDSSAPPVTYNATFVVTAPPTIALSYSATNNLVTATLTGGTYPFTYVWTTPYGSVTDSGSGNAEGVDNISTLSNGFTAFGTYSVIITDSSTPPDTSTASIFVPQTSSSPTTPVVQFKDPVNGKFYPNQSIVVLDPMVPLSLTIDVAVPTSATLVVPLKVNVYKSIFLHSIVKGSGPVIIHKYGIYSIVAYLPDGTTATGEIAVSNKL